MVWWHLSCTCSSQSSSYTCLQIDTNCQRPHVFSIYVWHKTWEMVYITDLIICYPAIINLKSPEPFFSWDYWCQNQGCAAWSWSAILTFVWRVSQKFKILFILCWFGNKVKNKKNKKNHKQTNKQQEIIKKELYGLVLADLPILFVWLKLLDLII